MVNNINQAISLSKILAWPPDNSSWICVNIWTFCCTVAVKKQIRVNLHDRLQLSSMHASWRVAGGNLLLGSSTENDSVSV